MEKKQSSIEWLKEVYINQGRILNSQFEQAKAMHKEEITDTYHDGKTNGMNISHDLSLTKEISSTEYYNETFGGDK